MQKTIKNRQFLHFARKECIYHRRQKHWYYFHRDSTVESHNSSDSTAYFLCGFFFVCFHVASRVGTDIDVIHHPAKYRMPTVGQLLLQRQFHEFLGRWGHILKSLTERNNGKAHGAFCCR